MYALKARDKLIKREKEAYEERHSPRNRRSKDGVLPSTVSREAKYVGTFAMDMKGGWKSDFEKAVKHQLSRVDPKDPSNALMLVSMLINMNGIKVLSADGRDVIMAHALKRILYCTCDSKKHLFAIVARNPQEGTEGVYTHVFVTAKKDQANDLNQLVSKAFKVHFASKTITKQKKEIVKLKRRSTSPQPPSSTAPPYNPNRSPSPQRLSPSPQPTVYPYNPAVVHPPTSHQLHPSGGGHANAQPWTVQKQKTRSELMQEAGVLELEIATIQTRLRDIEDQMRELAGFEDAITQLTKQTSLLQQQLEEKRRQLSMTQFQIQDQTLQDPNFLYPAGVVSYSTSPVVSPRRISDTLPDFSNLSLEDAEWFQEGIPRDIAMEILSQQPAGAFMVRQSTSNPGSFALSMKAPDKQILHYLIENVDGGARLQGSSVVFSSIVELVYSYTVNRENLPCTLNLSTSNPSFLEGDGGNGGSDDDDDDYRSVARYRLIS